MKKSIKAIILAGVLAIPLLAGCAKKTSGSSVSEGSTNSVSGSVQPVSSFTVTYLDWDSTVLTTIKVNQGDKAVYPLDKPTRSATAQYTYTFKGWDKEEALASVTADISTMAVYNESLNQYTYKFHDPKGKIEDKTAKVPYGTTVSSIKPADPASFDDEKARLRSDFVGWDSTGDLTADTLPETITGDVTFTAIWTETTIYAVRFLNYDGTVLKDGYWVKKGADAVYDKEDPKKEPTVANAYTFTGWDKSLTNIQADTDFTAQFTEGTRQYTVDFSGYCSLFGDGNYYCDEDWQDQADYGTKVSDISWKPTPNKEDYGYVSHSDKTVEYHFSFYGWDITGDNMADDLTKITVDRDLSFKAVYIKHQFIDLSIYDYKLDALYHQKADYGTSLIAVMNSAIGVTLQTKPSDAQYTYKFKGLSATKDTVGDGSVDVIDLASSVVDATTPSALYTIFTRQVRTYSITWNNDDGTLFKTTSHTYGVKIGPFALGSNPSAPTSKITPASGYYRAFQGWKIGDTLYSDKTTTYIVTGAVTASAVFADAQDYALVIGDPTKTDEYVKANTDADYTEHSITVTGNSTQTISDILANYSAKKNGTTSIQEYSFKSWVVHSGVPTIDAKLTGSTVVYPTFNVSSYYTQGKNILSGTLHAVTTATADGNYSYHYGLVSNYEGMVSGVATYPQFIQMNIAFKKTTCYDLDSEWSHALGLTASGGVYAIGNDSQYCLGLGTGYVYIPQSSADTYRTPQYVTSLSGKTITDIVTTKDASYAIDSTGHVYIAGSHYIGYTWGYEKAFVNMTSVEVGSRFYVDPNEDDHVLVLTPTGNIYGLGKGQCIGNASGSTSHTLSTTALLTPSQTAGITGVTGDYVTDLSIFKDTVYALTYKGRVIRWGADYYATTIGGTADPRIPTSAKVVNANLSNAIFLNICCGYYGVAVLFKRWSGGTLNYGYWWYGNNKDNEMPCLNGATTGTANYINGVTDPTSFAYYGDASFTKHGFVLFTTSAVYCTGNIGSKSDPSAFVNLQEKF